MSYSRVTNIRFDVAELSKLLARILHSFAQRKFKIPYSISQYHLRCTIYGALPMVE
jgi:hypothetical protein